MKEFLYANFGTTKVAEVPYDDLKEKLDGPSFLERINYRKAVGIAYKKEAIAKGTILKRENRSADSLEDHQKNDMYGFSCLHYSVSEAVGSLRIKIINKTKAAGKIGVRTVDGEACAGDDYIGIDVVIEFK